MPALRAFAACLDCALVVTQPARPAGRGHKLRATPVADAAAALGIATLAPERVRDAFEPLRETAADLFALASYGQLVPASILALPRLGALNVHPSLLPLYRGATPLQAQLRDGVRASGVTIILMDAGMDTGDIVLAQRSEIGPDETYAELHDRFAQLGAELLARACALAAAGPLPRVPQAGQASAIAATLTRPLTKAGVQLEWSWPAERIVNFVRSLSPAPGARAVLCGETVKVLAAARAERAGSAAAEPGAVAGTLGAAALIGCADGVVAVSRLVPPNRAAMTGADFVRAHRAS